jgi:hypothetical protein
MTYLLLTIILLLQDQITQKPNREFEITTKYELRKKPGPEANQVVFDRSEDSKRSNDSDMLPYLTLNIKIKKWAPGVAQIKITDSSGKIFLKKKPSDDGQYSLDMGFVDDMKDKVTSGKFLVAFLKEKKMVEQITIEVEEDGTFLVNGEKRGKF